MLLLYNTIAHIQEPNEDSDDERDGSQSIRISPEVYNVPAVKPSAGPFSDSGIEDKTNTVTDDMSIASYTSEVRKHK